MTSVAAGVHFDLAGRGTPIKLSWTAPGSDDAWLALDLNNNGRIDDGSELFTPSMVVGGRRAGRNGFEALAAFDVPENGGTEDGVIGPADSVYARLLLWGDRNHNGISEPDELITVANAGVTSIDLDYRESRFVDEHGNMFRYRTKTTRLRGSDAGKWAYDVILVTDRAAGSASVRSGGKARVVNSTGRVLQDCQQVVPTFVFRPVVAAPVDMQ